MRLKQLEMIHDAIIMIRGCLLGFYFGIGWDCVGGWMIVIGDSTMGISRILSLLCSVPALLYVSKDISNINKYKENKSLPHCLN